MILIRGDGNARIGAGHLMRCMTIAEELAALQGSGDKICFVCADEESGAFVRENGFRSYVLGTDYRDMESELPRWMDVWEELRSGKIFSAADAKRDSINEGSAVKKTAFVDCSVTILVDSYYVTDSYLAALREQAYTILMDDMGLHRYPVDCVVNYNAPADPEAYQRLYRGSGTRLLIGSRYTPLRRQFREAHAGIGQSAGAGSAGKQEQRSGADGTKAGILITTGGGDSGNIAGEILKRIYSDDYSFHLVMGRFHPYFQEMQALEKEHDNIHIHHDVKDMAELMCRCRIAVTAGGSTIYELAALGVPFICFSYAENQEALVEYIGDREIAGSAGAWHKDPDRTLDHIGKLFRELVCRQELWSRYRKNEIRMIDGKGAGRLALAILEAEAR